MVTVRQSRRSTGQCSFLDLFCSCALPPEVSHANRGHGGPWSSGSIPKRACGMDTIQSPLAFCFGGAGCRRSCQVYGSRASTNGTSTGQGAGDRLGEALPTKHACKPQRERGVAWPCWPCLRCGHAAAVSVDAVTFLDVLTGDPTAQASEQGPLSLAELRRKLPSGSKSRATPRGAFPFQREVGNFERYSIFRCKFNGVLTLACRLAPSRERNNLGPDLRLVRTVV